MTRPKSQLPPRVSVVVSVYNEATRVQFAIDRLLQQTFTDFELILVDDGSTDDTPMVLELCRKQDARIQIIRQDNAGLTKALIRGCSVARGEYIARHDADDWSSPTRLANQVALLDSNSGIGLVSCTTMYVGPNGEVLEMVVRDDAPIEATRKLLDEKQGPPAHGSVMFRRSLYESVGGYRSEFYLGQDEDLWMRMAERAMIAYDQQQLYTARRDPFSLSGSMGAIQQKFGRWGQECRAARREGRSEAPYLEEARKQTDEVRSQRTSQAAFGGQATMSYIIGTTLARRHDVRARQYFWKALSLNPFFWKAWVRLTWEFVRPTTWRRTP